MMRIQFSLASILTVSLLCAVWMELNFYPQKSDLDGVTVLGWPWTYRQQVHPRDKDEYIPKPSSSGLVYLKPIFVDVRIKYFPLALNAMVGIFLSIFSALVIEKIRNRFRRGKP